jgi:hypothetical protein
MRYAIEVLEPSGNWIELCRVASNPEAIAKAARAKTIKGEAHPPVVARAAIPRRARRHARQWVTQQSVPSTSYDFVPRKTSIPYARCVGC